LGIITITLAPMNTLTWKAIHEILEYSYNNGHPVDIHTKNDGVYEDCDVMSVDCTTDGGVEFMAVHPIKDCQYEFTIVFAEIEKVVLV